MRRVTSSVACRSSPDLDGNRLNEGKADPRGRLWFGSMSKTREPEQAALYRLDANGLSRIRTITTRQRHRLGRRARADVPRRLGDPADRRVRLRRDDRRSRERPHWATIDADDGLPDGLTIDSEGCVWLALFQGGSVRRFDPDGAVMFDVELPTPFVTCPVFGGDDLSTLFVTSSRHKTPGAAGRPPSRRRALRDRHRRRGPSRQPDRARGRRAGDRHEHALRGTRSRS